jgi:hypothetical protein
LPEIDCLAELLLLEAGIAQVVVQNPALESPLHQLPVTSLGAGKVALLVQGIRIGQKNSNRFADRSLPVDPNQDAAENKQKDNGAPTRRPAPT